MGPCPRAALSAAWLALALSACMPAEDRLRIAVDLDDPREAERALDAGADPDKGALHAAVRNRSVDLVRVLLAHGADPNVAVPQGIEDATPLHLALVTSDPERRVALVRLLLEAGADPDRPVTGSPALVDALEVRAPIDERPALLLIAAHADPNATWRGTSALVRALGDARGSFPAVFDALLAAGARPGSDGILAAALGAGNRRAFERMFEAGADVDALCPPGRAACTGLSPLALAARKGDLDTMRRLLDRGARTDGPGGVSPALHEAAAAGELDAMRLLLQRGASARATNAVGATALHRVGSTAAIRLLVDAGADLEAADKDGFTPLLAAIRNGTREPPPEAEAPAAAGTPPPAVQAEAVQAEAPVVKAEAEAPEAEAEAPEAEDKAPPEPPPFDPRRGDLARGLPLAVRLLEAGASPDRPGPSGLRPLHFALAAEDSLTTEKLLNSGAWPHARDASEPPPLLYLLRSARRVEPRIVWLVGALLDKGAPANTITPDGTAILTVAVELGYPEVCERLLDAGADPSVAMRVVEATRKKVRQKGPGVSLNDLVGVEVEIPDPDIAAEKSARGRVLMAARSRMEARR